MLESEYVGKLTYYKNKANLGLFGNWNRCIELAKGKWVCLLHSDDLLMPNYLRELKNAIDKLDESKVGMVSVESLFFGSHCETHRYPLSVQERLFSIYQGFYVNQKDCVFPYFHPGGLAHNRQIMLNLGGYNADEYPAGDTLFIRRVCQKYGVLVYQKYLHLSRQEINEGLKSGIEELYAYQTFYFYKDCIGGDYGRFCLVNLKSLLKGSFWRGRSVSENVINEMYKGVNVDFTLLSKCKITLIRIANKLKMIANKFNLNAYLKSDKIA